MSGHRQFTYEQVAAAFLYLPDTGKLYRRLSDGGLRPMLKGTLRACGNWVTLWDLVMLSLVNWIALISATVTILAMCSHGR